MDFCCVFDCIYVGLKTMLTAKQNAANAGNSSSLHTEVQNLQRALFNKCSRLYYKWLRLSVFVSCKTYSTLMT